MWVQECCACMCLWVYLCMPCNSLTGLKVGCLTEPGAFAFSPKLAANKAQWFSCLLPLHCWVYSHETVPHLLHGCEIWTQVLGVVLKALLTTKSSLQLLRVHCKGLHFCHKKGYPFKCTQERTGLPLSCLTWSVGLWPVCFSSLCLLQALTGIWLLSTTAAFFSCCWSLLAGTREEGLLLYLAEET